MFIADLSLIDLAIVRSVVSGAGVYIGRHLWIRWR